MTSSYYPPLSFFRHSSRLHGRFCKKAERENVRIIPHDKSSKFFVEPFLPLVEGIEKCAGSSGRKKERARERETRVSHVSLPRARSFLLPLLTSDCYAGYSG